MLEKINRGILVIILGISMILGAYLGFLRFQIEKENRTIEFCIDLNDLKKMAAFEKKPFEPVLDEFKKRGITSLGVFEETLPDANALGEVYYTKGSGILALKKIFPAKPSKISPNRTYLYIPKKEIRKRIYDQLSWVLGRENIKFLGKNILEVNEAEEEIRNLGLGMSELQVGFLKNKGFRIIPRLWNDFRYHLGNIDLKVSALKEFGLIIFDGEEILGYPDAIPTLASSFKKNKIKYGYLEIVKQKGDPQLRSLMEEEIVRVHSISPDELKKISKEEARDRFLRAVRERGVRLIYLRPFLPPAVDAFPIDYNLNYLNELKIKIEKAGFIIGKESSGTKLRVEGWQIVTLGLGAVVGGIFLLNYFIKISALWNYLILILAGAIMVFFGFSGKELLVQKYLAFLTSIIFPSYAVISTLSGREKALKLIFGQSIFNILNIVTETVIGIFLLIGLLADSRLMVGAQTFAGIKLALILPILIVALYFLVKERRGNLKDLLGSKVTLLSVILGIFVLAALVVLMARSANFVLPVPLFEKYFRNFLEMSLLVRPRTKEFLIGYPLLFLASVYFLRGKRKWLWLLASLGAIAPISLFNSFMHIHTPLLISVIRSVNGLVLGTILGISLVLIFGRFMPND